MKESQIGLQKLQEILQEEGPDVLLRAQVYLRKLLAESAENSGMGITPRGLPDITWCEVPEGPAIVGEEQERRSVTLEAYAISKYPVTNEQYAAFVADGGYTERWRAAWSNAGWAWKRGLSGPKRYGKAFDEPNHPVVGVSWYEAEAFCNWLSACTGQQIKLPSEHQWEKAARGTDGRTYPWGEEEPDSSRCNFNSNVGHTTPVNAYPASVSPYGVLDMAGNVWEWTNPEEEGYANSNMEEEDD